MEGPSSIPHSCSFATVTCSDFRAWTVRYLLSSKPNQLLKSLPSTFSSSFLNACAILLLVRQPDLHTDPGKGREEEPCRGLQTSRCQASHFYVILFHNLLKRSIRQGGRKAGWRLWQGLERELESTWKFPYTKQDEEAGKGISVVSVKSLRTELELKLGQSCARIFTV